MTQEEVEKTFAGLSPYYAYKQGLQDAVAYTWDSFRREAAKDILASWYSNPDSDDRSLKQLAQIAIEQADELIKQLQEDEK